MTEQWLTYERKRNAFEKRYSKAIKQALNAQLSIYVDSYKRGQPNYNALAFDATILLDLYANVGGYFAKQQYRELRREARPARNNTGSDRQGGKAYLVGYNVKRGALGFSIDWARRIIDRLRFSAINLASRISQTTREHILRILEQAQTDNLTLDETVARITDEVQGINERRAETIARTEVGRAANEGKRSGAKELGVKLRKEWVSARDQRTRVNPGKDPRKGDHWVLNGQVKDFNEPFSNGVHQLMQPGDPEAPPSETVNCRCVNVYSVVKDEEGKPVPYDYIDKPTPGIQQPQGIALQQVLEAIG